MEPSTFIADIEFCLSRQVKETASILKISHPALARQESEPLPDISIAPIREPCKYTEHGKKLVQSDTATPIDAACIVEFWLRTTTSQSNTNSSQFGHPAAAHGTTWGMVIPCKSCKWPVEKQNQREMNIKNPHGKQEHVDMKTNRSRRLPQ